MKLLFAIISCHKNRHRRDAVRNSWLKDVGNNADYKFFVGQGDSELEPDVIKLDVPDDYNSLPIKIKAVCQYMLDWGYDYVLKVDDDTYVFPDRIVFGIEEADYIGRWNAWSNSKDHPNGFCSGFCYWLSARSAKILANGSPNIKAEDVWAGGELARNGVFAKNDKRYYIIAVIGKPMWTHFIKMGACFAQFENGMMEYFHRVVKGEVILENLPATGRNSRLYDPRTGRHFQLGYVHRRGVRNG